MSFDMSATLKVSLITALCIAAAVYISSYTIKPHLCTRAQQVDPDLVHTYTGFAAMVAFLTVFLQALVNSQLA